MIFKPKFLRRVSVSFFAILLHPCFADDTVNRIVDQGIERTKDNQKIQQRVDKEHLTTLSLIEKYEDMLKEVEGLHAYNKMMTRQVARQNDEMALLRDSIADVSVIERQMLPLLSRMIDGLEAFIELDVPFLMDERLGRVTTLRKMIERVDVTIAEKTRRVFEGYQIEMEYGRTIEAYRSKLATDGGVFDVDFLRIGRTTLLYRTVGTQELGMWNALEKRWEGLEQSTYRRHFEEAIKVARQEKAPDLLTVPMLYEGGGQ